MTLSSKFCFCLFLILLLIGLRTPLKGQTCPPNNVQVNLTNQAEVDAFAQTYGTGCTFAQGVRVRDSGSQTDESITNLDSLYTLTEVGRLEIRDCNSLTDITGLSNLATLNSLAIRNCSSLTNIDGLTSIIDVITSLDVSNCTSLNNLSGLSNLQSVPELRIINCWGLQTLGFQSLTTVSRGLVVDRCFNLANIDELATVTGVVSDYLTIMSLYLIPDIDGLSGITNVYGPVSIRGNRAITNLDGLSNLQSVELLPTSTNLSQIDFSYNNLLTDITGIADLHYTGQSIIIRNNPMLSECTIAPICENLNEPFVSFTIQENLPGCNSKVEVENTCGALPVNLLSFHTVATGKTIQLNWQVTSEENTWKYTLERSADGGRTFQTIGSVAARNLASGADYAYTDETAASLNVERLYYRLEVRDFDGSDQRFGPVLVEMSSLVANLLKVFPNPTPSNQTINIQGAAAGAKLELRAMGGRLLSTLVPNGEGAYALPDMKAGVYIIRTQNDQGLSLSGRFVVK